MTILSPHVLTYFPSSFFKDGANDYWTTQTGGWCEDFLYQDLWQDDHPATNLAPPLTCSQTNQAPDCAYEDDILANFTVNSIMNHDPTTGPLFLYLTWHNVHEPLEVPDAQLAKFDFVFANCTNQRLSDLTKGNSCSQAFLDMKEDDPMNGRYMANKPCCFRQFYSAMTNYVDGHIGMVIDALKTKGMWNDTLLVMSSDNGGPIYRNGSAGANNFP